MPSLSRTQRWLALFLIVDAGVYIATAREWTGGPMLVATALAFAYLALVIGASVRRAAKAHAAQPSEDVGAVELEHVGPTIWPAVFALSAILLSVGAAVVRWLLIPGGLLFVAAALGWAADIRQQHRHHDEHSGAEHPGAVSPGSGTPSP
jgi:uncharacterized membrane protein